MKIIKFEKIIANSKNAIHFWAKFEDEESEKDADHLIYGKEKPSHRREIFLIARSNKNKEHYFISEIISEEDVIKLFDLAGTVDKNNKRIQEDKFEEEFNFIGLDEKIEDFRFFVYENDNKNIWENKSMNWNNHHPIFRKNHNTWYLKLNGLTEPWRDNQFQYKYFINKKNNKEIKNFYFVFENDPSGNTMPSDFLEDGYEFYPVEQYWEDLEKYEKKLNLSITKNKVWPWFTTLKEIDEDEEE